MDLSSPDCVLALLFPSLSRALPIPMPYLNLLIQHLPNPLVRWDRRINRILAGNHLRISSANLKGETRWQPRLTVGEIHGIGARTRIIGDFGKHMMIQHE